jgi:hypothetical protein
MQCHPEFVTAATSQWDGTRRFPLFDDAAYATYFDAVAALEQYGALPDLDAANRTTIDNCVASGAPPFSCSTYAQARNLAHSTWLDQNRLVPWSLTDYTSTQLIYLLSLNYGKPDVYQYYWLLLRPDQVRQLWNRDAMNGAALSTRIGFENRMAQWIRDHFIHMEDGNTVPAEFSDFINGNTNCQRQTTYLCVGACTNNGFFMSALATAFNVPAVAAQSLGPILTGHTYMDFPADARSIAHSDDLYSYGDFKNAPVSHLFMGGDYRTTFMNNTNIYFLSYPPTCYQVAAERARMSHLASVYFRSLEANLVTQICSGRQAILDWLQPRWKFSDAVRPDVDAQLTPVIEKKLRQLAGCPTGA